METCTASPMNSDRPTPGSQTDAGAAPDVRRLGRYAQAEHELDRLENAQRCEEDIREVDFSVFILLGMAVMILLGVVVLVVL